MGKLKTIEIIVLAASALLAAVKSIISFIGYIGKLKTPSPETT